MFTGGGVLRNRCFNPRTREGCDGCLFGLHQLTKVSIHAPVRGATCRCWARPSAWGCFNPRTREGCDLPSLVVPNVSQVVSIHAPVRGATLLPFCSSTFSTDSIHAPVRGATGARSTSSRSPCVSIHAPVRGATCHQHNVQGVIAVSIHAPVRGATYTSTNLTNNELFQSTHP